jgi:hypothetical protein
MTDRERSADEDEPTDRDRPLWSLSRDEQRILLITFAGGLGSIVVGAAMVGVAFALAHYEQRVHQQDWRDVGEITGILALMTLGLVVAQQSKGRRFGARKIPLLVVWVLVILAWCTYLLWLVGIAAGIH